MSKTTLADGSPVTPDHCEINPDTGMQKDYVVLSEEERAKGFVNPVRLAYVHEKCGVTTTMSRSIAETYARDPGFYSGTYCCHCRAHFPVGANGEFVWHGTNEKVGTPVVASQTPALLELHGLDTAERVCFYEQDFYVLSNFSAFTLWWKGQRFDTSEAAYHWEKFPNNTHIQEWIRKAPSAHEAFKIAEDYKSARRPDWDSVKVCVMRDILRQKVRQHEYVFRKLLATGDRELVENSWRDDYWGWGPKRNGQNMLGKLWMEIRAELRGSK